MMKRLKICLAALIALAWIGSGQIALGQSPDSALDRIVNQIETMFPPVEGYVVAVEGDKIILDLKEGDPIKAGDKLDLVRFGETLMHPVSKKELGRNEEELGQVRISRVSRNFSIARSLKRVVGSKEKPKVGDGVRMPFAKLSIVIAPVKGGDKNNIDGNQLILDLEKRLKAKDRFDVPAFDLGVWMLESGVKRDQLTDRTVLEKFKEKTDADFILAPEVRTVRKKMVVSYKLISTKENKVVKKADVLSDQIAARPKAGAKRSRGGFRNGLPGNEAFEFVHKQEFGYQIVDFAIGDVNGNGENEYVILDSYKVNIYRREKSGNLRKITHWKGSREFDSFIAVDVADLNGNGIKEIFVTNQTGNTLSSFVLEANPKKKRMEKIWDDKNLYFRSIQTSSPGEKIIAQSPGYTTPFEDGIKIVRYKDGKFKLGSNLPLPKVYETKWILFGLTQAKLSSKKGSETIILDKNYHLRVYSSSGRLLEKSDDYYGHDPRILNLGEKPQAVTGMVSGDTGVHFRGRLEFARQGDTRYLLIPKNNRLGGEFVDKFVNVSSSSLIILEVTPAGFVKFVETAKQKGYLASYRILDLPQSQEKLVHVLSVDSGGFSSKRATSSLFTYKWKRL